MPFGVDRSVDVGGGLTSRTSSSKIDWFTDHVVNLVLGDEMRPSRFLLCFVLTGTIAFGSTSIAYAHAFLDHASPAVGSTVYASPSEVRIWFSDSIEPDFSSITVTDASGRRVDNGKTETDPKDASELWTALAPLQAGTYAVTWRVVSVDTHSTEGDFTFSVAP